MDYNVNAKSSGVSPKTFFIMSLLHCVTNRSHEDVHCEDGPDRQGVSVLKIAPLAQERRWIANPMVERPRGFKSPSSRAVIFLDGKFTSILKSSTIIYFVGI